MQVNLFSNVNKIMTSVSEYLKTDIPQAHSKTNLLIDKP